MSSKHPLVHDFIESLREFLAIAGSPVDRQSQNLFGCSPLICQGCYFGPDKTLTERHAPFVAISPAADVDAEIELYRNDDQGAAPRSFAIDIVVALAHSDPVALPPEKDQARTTPATYIAGNGSAGEAFAMSVINATTTCFSAFGFTVSAATCSYSGVIDWPLETYNIRLFFGASRTTNTGAF